MNITEDVQPLIYVVGQGIAAEPLLIQQLSRAGMKVVTFWTAVELLAYRDERLPSCLLIDMHLPDTTGPELLRRLRNLGLKAPILIIAQPLDVRLTVDAMRLGAFEVLQKHSLHVSASVQRALLKDQIDHTVARAQEAIGMKWIMLSALDRLILRLAAQGKTNREIARLLPIAESTIRLRRAGAMQRMGALTTGQLARMLDHLPPHLIRVRYFS